jgi:hypothetical protein
MNAFRWHPHYEPIELDDLYHGGTFFSFLPFFLSSTFLFCESFTHDPELIKPLSAPVRMMSFDFQNLKNRTHGTNAMESHFELRMTQDGVCNAVVFWYVNWRVVVVVVVVVVVAVVVVVVVVVGVVVFIVVFVVVVVVAICLLRLCSFARYSMNMYENITYETTPNFLLEECKLSANSKIKRQALQYLADEFTVKEGNCNY